MLSTGWPLTTKRSNPSNYRAQPSEHNDLCDFGKFVGLGHHYGHRFSWLQHQISKSTVITDTNNDRNVFHMTNAILINKFPNRYIKMSSPHLNNLIILGCMCTYLSVIFLGLDSGLSSIAAFPYGTNKKLSKQMTLQSDRNNSILINLFVSLSSW